MDFGIVSRNTEKWPYEQVAADIRNAIRSGELRPGERLPSVGRITQEAQCSRGAVQNAIAVLRDEGLIRPRDGWGTFVADPLPPEEPPSQT